MWGTFFFTCFSKGMVQTFFRAASASFLSNSDICSSSNLARRDPSICQSARVMSSSYLVKIAITGTVAKISQLLVPRLLQHHILFPSSPVTFKLRKSSTPVSRIRPLALGIARHNLRRLIISNMAATDHKSVPNRV
jgi:hypothetical protein